MYCFLHSGVMWADKCSANFIFGSDQLVGYKSVQKLDWNKNHYQITGKKIVTKNVFMSVESYERRFTESSIGLRFDIQSIERLSWLPERTHFSMQSLISCWFAKQWQRSEPELAIRQYNRHSTLTNVLKWNEF